LNVKGYLNTCSLVPDPWAVVTRKFEALEDGESNIVVMCEASGTQPLDTTWSIDGQPFIS